MSYLEKLKQTATAAFEASENPEELKQLKLVQDEIAIAENLINTKLSESDERYETLKAEHVKLIKSVPSGNEPEEDAPVVSDRTRYVEWKAGLRK